MSVAIVAKQITAKFKTRTIHLVHYSAVNNLDGIQLGDSCSLRRVPSCTYG